MLLLLLQLPFLFFLILICFFFDPLILFFFDPYLFFFDPLAGRNRPGKVCRKRAPQDVFQTEMLENWLQGTSYGTGSQKRQLFPKLCHNHENHIPLFIFYFIRTFDKHDQYKYMQKSSRMSHKIRRGRTGCLLVNHRSAIWREDKACLPCAVSWLKIMTKTNGR